MKLIYYIISRVTLSVLVVMGVWAALFYYSMVDEVQDETDDLLEDYATMVIQNFLAGEPIPDVDNGSNSSYSLKAVNAESVQAAMERDGFENREIFVEYKNEYEPARILRHIFRDGDDNYYEVTVMTPTIDKSDLVDAIWNSMLILFGMLIIVILVINILAIKGGLRPLRRFLTWLNSSSIENDNFVPNSKDSNVAEIQELTRAFEGYAKRGQRAFEQQKEFIGNASHELQTPIAICQNRLELLTESDLTEEQLTQVGECLNTLSRLSRLNKSLLMLSKIDNGGFETEDINLNQIVEDNVSYLQDIYASRNISLKLEQRGECLLNANRDLVSTLIVNLLKNSYSHSRAGAQISVIISSDLLQISNTGDGKSLDNEKIFSRFYQGSTKSGSYGLGLSIVQSICKLYGYEISYNYCDNTHNFTINF